jgi:hypothetical protein
MGKTTTNRENFWVNLLAFAVTNAILYWGGWYDSFFQSQNHD